jgi:hypothetical protein
MKPICSPAQPGCWIVAPLWPQAVQRAHRRSLSLDVSAPHRMTGTAQASGAWCGHFSQLTHTHGDDRCRSPSVVRARVMGALDGSRRRRV